MIKPSAIWAPLSAVYGAILWLRHWLYDRGWLYSYRPTVATVCVGNLAVGGTGKTPMVEYLLEQLQGRYRVAVLSRGYGRKTKGYRLAGTNETAATIGDEPLQLHRKYPAVALAVSADRVQGIRQLQKDVPGLEVVVLDDGFQHRAIRPGFSILLTPADRLWSRDHLLPWGWLRDLKSRADKADAIVVSKCPLTLSEAEQQDIRQALGCPQQPFFAGIAYSTLQHTGRPLLLSGIARPEYLEAEVRKRWPNAKTMIFSDHHAYTEADGLRIEAAAADCDFILTTEKDWQRLPRLQKEVVVLPIRLQWLQREQDFLDTLLHYIESTLKENI